MAIPANKTESTIDDDSSNSSESPEMAIMFMDLNVTENSNLEVFFTCLVLGWNSSNNVLNRLDNPTLQILYDDVLVFSIENAITNQTASSISNTGYNMQGWNQFRLFSR